MEVDGVDEVLFVPESPGGYLKGETGWSFPEAVVFETGGNRWHTHDQWPPKGLVRKKLYFRAEGKLSFDPPEESNARDHDSYLSDPTSPFPTQPRFALTRDTNTWSKISDSQPPVPTCWFTKAAS